ncbi:MAG: hypothetical protein ACOC22_04700 [bacterium]
MILIVSGILVILGLIGLIFLDKENYLKSICACILFFTIFFGFIIFGTSIPVDKDKKTIDFEFEKFQNCVIVLVPDKKYVELFDNIELYNSSKDGIKVYWIEDYNSYGRVINEYIIVEGKNFKLEGEEHVK